ncbi:MAG TPA: sugar phosphate isomerase/epimerase family protein [Fimbriimonadaceae bacterium]|nr:sugar phosphate isomerase/epimerase family protein [Fimbriimonadaceae bacterium]
MNLKGINYWSYPGEPSLDEFFAKAKRDGFECVEPAIADSGELNLDVTQTFCEDAVSRAESLGLSIHTMASGTYWNYNLASPDEADCTKAVNALQRMLQITSWFGANTLLTIPGAVDVFFMPDAPVQNYGLVWERAIEGLEKVLPVAEECEVSIGIENVWNKFLLSPLEMRIFIDQFESEWVGSYFDVGNVMAYGYPQQWIRILGHRIKAIHVKDYRRAVGTAEGFVDLCEGDVPWGDVMDAIREVAYEGPLTAEMIPHYPTNPEMRCANTSRALDMIMGRN